MKEHIITWFLSVLSACIVGAAWIYTHPSSTRLGLVDLNAVMSEEIAKLDKSVKPDMTDKDKQALQARATETMKKIDAAIKQTAQDCGCTLLVAAAVAAGSPEVKDWTWRVRELVAR